jgi:hypothetical protein
VHRRVTRNHAKDISTFNNKHKLMHD